MIKRSSILYWQLLVEPEDTEIVGRLSDIQRTVGGYRFSLVRNMRNFNPSLQVETLCIALLSQRAINNPVFRGEVNKGIYEAISLNPTYALLLVPMDKYVMSLLPDSWHEMPILNEFEAKFDEEQLIMNILRAIKLVPGDTIFVDNNIEVKLFSGKIFRRFGLLDAATKTFEAATIQWPLSYSAWFNLGVAFSLHSQLPAAANAFETALSIEPESINGWLWLASIYEDMSGLENARFA